MINPTSFPTNVLQSLQVLDLTNNNFICTCDLMWFRNWIRGTNVNIVDKHKYKYYKDVSLWWIIAKANDLDEAHIGLEVDRQIRIPTEIEPIINKLKEMSY